MQLKKKDVKKKKEEKNNSWSRTPPSRQRRTPIMTPPAARNPARHATGEMPLQSEASLKCRLQCLGPQAIKLLSKHRELPARVGGHRGRSGWAAAGAGILRNGWEFGRRASVEGLPRWTITVGNFFRYWGIYRYGEVLGRGNVGRGNAVAVVQWQWWRVSVALVAAQRAGASPCIIIWPSTVERCG